MDQDGLSQIIEELKRLLIDVSVRQKFNLQHPEVQQISRTLDGYIVQYMKIKQQGKTSFPQT
ncbi:Spo0E family sporulation regulatory protein-aspartic acid phosphatase [Paenibacillus sp. TAB 01]|uniref:Spo0E family sporulation regulatory protein-aspartic acid phosphatase n=1 Tax=Paenibacillus sp. TAB 01 TaxID=3368988 RepID=UPI003753BC24